MISYFILSLSIPSRIHFSFLPSRQRRGGEGRGVAFTFFSVQIIAVNHADRNRIIHLKAAVSLTVCERVYV